MEGVLVVVGMGAFAVQISDEWLDRPLFLTPEIRKLKISIQRQS